VNDDNDNMRSFWDRDDDFAFRSRAALLTLGLAVGMWAGLLWLIRRLVGG
jgi:hypothetical protein